MHKNQLERSSTTDL